MALITSVPSQKDRGGFMSINSSFQQFAGGLAATAGGLITFQNSSGRLINYNILRSLTVVFVVVSIFLMRKIDRRLQLS
jgi:predicted MFS family arabinose efflux permease